MKIKILKYNDFVNENLRDKMVGKSDDEIKDVIKIASEYGLKELITNFINDDDIDGMIFVMAESGIGINDGISPNNSTSLMLSSYSEKKIVFDYLISREDIIIDKQNNNKDTALIFASSNGNLYKVKKLVEKGANVFNKNNSNKLPLDEAISSSKHEDENDHGNYDFDGVIEFLKEEMKKGD